MWTDELRFRISWFLVRYIFRTRRTFWWHFWCLESSGTVTNQPPKCNISCQTGRIKILETGEKSWSCKKSCKKSCEKSCDEKSCEKSGKSCAKNLAEILRKDKNLARKSCENSKNPANLGKILRYWENLVKSCKILRGSKKSCQSQEKSCALVVEKSWIMSKILEILPNSKKNPAKW